MTLTVLAVAAAVATVLTLIVYAVPLAPVRTAVRWVILAIFAIGGQMWWPKERRRTFSEREVLLSVWFLGFIVALVAAGVAQGQEATPFKRVRPGPGLDVAVYVGIGGARCEVVEFRRQSVATAVCADVVAYLRNTLHLKEGIRVYVDLSPELYHAAADVAAVNAWITLLKQLPAAHYPVQKIVKIGFLTERAKPQK